MTVYPGQRLVAEEFNETDTGWSSTGFTAGTGWSIIYARGRTKNGVVYVEGYLTRTGADIVATSGNVPDQTVLTVPTAYRPALNDVPLYLQASLSSAGGRLGTTGVVTIMVAGATIATNQTVQFQAAFPKD